jgi:hypothetical protein
MTKPICHALLSASRQFARLGMQIIAEPDEIDHRLNTLSALWRRNALCSQAELNIFGDCHVSRGPEHHADSEFAGLLKVFPRYRDKLAVKQNVPRWTST